MKITVRGLVTVERDIAGLPQSIRNQLSQDANVIMNPLVADAQLYPPELPNQRYERTGDLGEGWNDGLLVQHAGDTTTISAINTVPYADDVQVEGQQDKFFVGRWTPIEQIATNREPDVTAIIDRSVESVTRKL